MLLLSRDSAMVSGSEERVVSEGPLRAVKRSFCALLLRSCHQVPPRVDPEFWFLGHLLHSLLDPLGQGRPLAPDVQCNAAQIRRMVRISFAIADVACQETLHLTVLNTATSGG